MLQRAASNAYSWWWASHIRTKQSKWLEQNLQDMDEKVKVTLKLLQDDGDSFAKRAEMYYRKRPELINFVEESFRQYKALAERYNHISGELQNANNTIATVFPEQVQFAIEDDDEDSCTPRAPARQHKLDPGKLVKNPPPEPPKKEMPKVPKIPKKDVKGLLTLPTKRVQAKTIPSPTTTGTNSRMSKAEALEQIDKLQKGILALQTEKEFVKGSYESSLAKFYEIEKQIGEMQDEVCNLQDEFRVNTFIEDDEARSLMAATALKSCQESLDKLLEKQNVSVEDTRVEHKRIKEAIEKFEKLKLALLPNQSDQQKLPDKGKSLAANSSLNSLEEVAQNISQGTKELESIRKKIREHIETDTNSSITVTEFAEKIDKLVTKVISLETAVSSQNALMKRLKSETTELHTHLDQLEEEKLTPTKDLEGLAEKLRKLEVELHDVQDVNKNIENQNNNLQTHFIEARCNLDHLTEKLQSVRYEEEEVEDEDEEEDEEEVETPTDPVQTEKVTADSLQTEKTADSLLTEKRMPDLEQIGDTTATSLQAEVATPVEAVSTLNVESHNDLVKGEDTANSRDDLKAKITVTEMGKGVDDVTTDQKTSHKRSTTQINFEGLSEKKECDNQGINGSEVIHEGSKTQADIEAASQKHEKPNELDDVENTELSKTGVPDLDVELQEQEDDQDPTIDWKKILLHGLEDREKLLLSEYTSILRNYKDVKKKLTEVEKKHRESLFERIMQVRDLKNSNATKDDEIRALRQKLNLMQQSFEGSADTRVDEGKGSQMNKSRDSTEERSGADGSMNSDNLNVEAPTRTEKTAETHGEEQEESKMLIVDEPHVLSTIEEKFRKDIDELLEENLEFWLRFSTSFHQIQKFQTSIQDLQTELSQLKDKKKQEGSSKEGKESTSDRPERLDRSERSSRSLKSDARPIYKHLREIQTELTVWLEKSTLLKDELQCRFSSLCDIQEEISKVLKMGSSKTTSDDIELTSVQAAKFQGEVLNMKQENNKVADELQAGLDHVNSLQLDIEKTLAKLNDEYKFSGSSKSASGKQSSGKPRIPLRSFLFGSKPAKKKPSIFLCINPALHRHHNHNSTDLADGLPPI
ncbi:hypothetical protein C5167_014498 [Papaver somniferum]|uniref:NAB domain-containing protein n=1 Tax=Papaver somniferum TaxID=3469 RepID=A0A4Y7J790_PAPSO|nr:protein NETWORKED 2D-like [Papaver somniferum]RZC55638.1 hypothetical protein C5167_014498 [Papaver somniferum]